MERLVFAACLALLAGCASDPMARRVSTLVDETTQAATESKAFWELQSLGPESVPYIVSHLGDARPLAVKHIALENRSPNAFEGITHYGPEVVHDALSAILTQIAGQSFEAVYNGSTPEQRKADKEQWQAWCVKTYPAKAKTCSK